MQDFAVVGTGNGIQPQEVDRLGLVILPIMAQAIVANYNLPELDALNLTLVLALFSYLHCIAHLLKNVLSF